MENQAKLAGQSWMEKVKAFLKGGDDAKLSRFSTRVDKYYKKQIAMRKENLVGIDEKIVDANEDLENYVLNVDFDRMGNAESLDSYSALFSQTVVKKLQGIEELEAQKKTIEEEIAIFEKAAVTVFGK